MNKVKKRFKAKVQRVGVFISPFEIEYTSEIVTAESEDLLTKKIDAIQKSDEKWIKKQTKEFNQLNSLERRK